MQNVEARLAKKQTRRAAAIDVAVTPRVDVPEAPHSYPAPLSSDVFLARPPAPINDVTLVVYEWHNVQPGTLSWVFPSVTSAVEAVRAMKNAVRWLVLRGRRSDPPADLEEERARGFVLCEA